MQETTATLAIGFTLECPSCGEEYDLTDSEYEGLYMGELFSLPKDKNIQQTLEGQEFECVNCEETFKITGTDY